jgi:hypothetical protein
MEKGKTNLQALLYGIIHIAENHGFSASTDWEEDGQVAIFGFNAGDNVPTLMDVKFLCEDVGISSSNINTTLFGIDIDIPTDWLESTATEKFDGMCYWERVIK